MNAPCERWKEQLLEAALTGGRPKDLELHLRDCKACTAELRELEAVRARQDSLLPLLVGGSRPSPDFRTRVLAGAEAGSERKRAPRWRLCVLAGATVVAVVIFIVQRGAVRKDEAEELAAAQKLAEWRSPSHSLLKTPGEEMLKSTPKLGESYLRLPVNKPAERALERIEEE